MLMRCYVFIMEAMHRPSAMREVVVDLLCRFRGDQNGYRFHSLTWGEIQGAAGGMVVAAGNRREVGGGVGDGGRLGAGGGQGDGEGGGARPRVAFRHRWCVGD